MHVTLNITCLLKQSTIKLFLFQIEVESINESILMDFVLVKQEFQRLNPLLCPSLLFSFLFLHLMPDTVEKL